MASTNAQIAAWNPSAAQRRIVKLAVAEFGETMAELLSASRRKTLVHARQASAYALRHLYPSLSYPQVAKTVGWTDHSTAIYAVSRARELILRDPVFADVVELLLAQDPVPGAMFAQISAAVAAVSPTDKPVVKVPDNPDDLPDRGERIHQTQMRKSSAALRKALRAAHPDRFPVEMAG